MGCLSALKERQDCCVPKCSWGSSFFLVPGKKQFPEDRGHPGEMRRLKGSPEHVSKEKRL